MSNETKPVKAKKTTQCNRTILVGDCPACGFHFGVDVHDKPDEPGRVTCHVCGAQLEFREER